MVQGSDTVYFYVCTRYQRRRSMRLSYYLINKDGTNFEFTTSDSFIIRLGSDGKMICIMRDGKPAFRCVGSDAMWGHNLHCLLQVLEAVH